MDKYDEEIAFLKANPDHIHSSWFLARPLFAFIGDSNDINGDIRPGCLTQIKARVMDCGAFINGKLDQQLTDEIRADERIPSRSNDITVNNLPVFAEWQRKIDLLRNQQNQQS